MSNLTSKIETPTANSTYPKGGVSCSKDSFIVKKICTFNHVL
jgi:hypothetical protein